MKALSFLEWYSQDIGGEPLDYQLRKVITV